MRTSINGSTLFAQALARGERYFKAYATITLYGTLSQGQQRVYELDNKYIMQDGIKLSQSTSETNKFTVGSFILDKLTLILYNDDGRFNDPNFANADVDLVISLDGLTKNDGIRIGRFKVTDVSGRNTSLITLTCMDYGVKFNKPYVARTGMFTSSTTETAIRIIHDCLSQCGVDNVSGIESQLLMPNQAFPNPEDEELTCGQVISAIAQLNCRYVKMTSEGQLSFQWYHSTADATIDSVFGFTYGSEELHYTGLKLKTDAKHYATTTTASGGTNYETTPHISSVGESDYMYVIENNPMLRLMLNGLGSNDAITARSDEVMAQIWNVLVSNTFTPVTINALWNPFLEAGDTITTHLRIGGVKRTVTTVINDVRWTVGGQATYSCEAEIPSRNVSQSMSAASVVEREVKKLLRLRINDWQNAYNNMLSDIAHATGFHVTEITEPGGLKIEYYHNGNPDVDRDGNGDIIYSEYYDEDTGTYRTEPSFSTATFLIKHAGSVIAASTDNGETWNWAINVDGEFIAQQIAAHKLIADEAIVGNLTVKKFCDDHMYEEEEDNPIMLQLTLPYIDDNGTEHYGRALLNADQVSITSGLSSGQLQTLAEAFEETSKVWFSNVVPTENNYPASSWTTNAVKLSHVGDVCVNSKTGKSYRYEHLVQGQCYKFSQDSELAVKTVSSTTYKDEISIYYMYDNKYYLACTFNDRDMASKKVFIPSNKMYIYYKSYNYTKEVTTDGSTMLLNGVYLAYDSKGYGTIDDVQVESLPTANSYNIGSAAWQKTTTRSSSMQSEIGNDANAFCKHNLKRTNGYTVNETKRFDITTHSDSDYESNYGDTKYAWQEIEDFDLNTPAKILERLTDGFAMEGLYMQNGKLYINMSYLRSGAIQIAEGNTEIFYAGYDSTQQRNVVRIVPDALTIAAGSLQITGSNGTKTLQNYLEGDVLTQAKLVELINGGALAQGLYIENGQLYISFNYAKGGELALGGVVSGSATDDEDKTYAKGKLRVYSENSNTYNNLVGFWAGSTLSQYRERASSSYDVLTIRRDWEKTVMYFLTTSPASQNYVFKEYNVVGYSTSSGAYTSSATNAYSTSYNYYTVREQKNAGYKLCTYYLDIYSGSYAYNTINNSSSSSSYTKPVISLATASQTLGLDLVRLNGSFGAIDANLTNLTLKFAGSSYRHVDSTNHILLEMEYYERLNTGYNYYRVHTAYPWRFQYDTYFQSSTFFTGTVTFDNTLYINNLSIFDYTATFNGNVSILGNNFYVFYTDSSNNYHYAIYKDNSTIELGLPVKLVYSMTNVSSGRYLVLGSNNQTICYLDQSSKRFKDVKREIGSSDVADLYDIKVYEAKFKEGYLAEDDQRNGMYYPMFIAEDVYEHFPEAVDLNENGEPINWNMRVLIPSMFQMIKSQKEEMTASQKQIASLQDKVASLEDRLAKLEKLFSK